MLKIHLCVNKHLFYSSNIIINNNYYLDKIIIIFFFLLLLLVAVSTFWVPGTTRYNINTCTCIVLYLGYLVPYGGCSSSLKIYFFFLLCPLLRLYIFSKLSPHDAAQECGECIALFLRCYHTVLLALGLNH